MAVGGLALHAQRGVAYMRADACRRGSDAIQLGRQVATLPGEKVQHGMEMPGVIAVLRTQCGHCNSDALN